MPVHAVTADDLSAKVDDLENMRERIIQILPAADFPGAGFLIVTEQRPFHVLEHRGEGA